MIKFEEIDDSEVQQLATFLATAGHDGLEPEWYKMFALALAVNAPVWEVEETLAAYDRSMKIVSKREWIRRGMVVMFARAQVNELKLERTRRRVGGVHIIGQ